MGVVDWKFAEEDCKRTTDNQREIDLFKEVFWPSNTAFVPPDKMGKL
jgi:hypothetical protein